MFFHNICEPPSYIFFCFSVFQDGIQITLPPAAGLRRFLSAAALMTGWEL